MRHIVEEEERRKMEPDLVPSVQRSGGENNDPYALLKAGRSGFSFSLKQNISFNWNKIFLVLTNNF